MGDIADALRRARDQEAMKPERPNPARELDLDAIRAISPLPNEKQRTDEQPPGIPATRIDGGSKRVAQVAHARDVAPLASEEPPRTRRVKRVAINREPTGRLRAERIALTDPTSAAGAASRRFAQHVKRHASDRKMRSIIVTSPHGGDGKTTVSCNLAVSLARLDRSHSVVLVDLDLRRPRVAESFQLPVEIGVDEILLRRGGLDEALIETDEPGLFVLAPKRSSSSPEQMLASENLRWLIDALTRRFWMVVIDTPPVLAVADATNVLDVADGCLLVVRAGTSPTSGVTQAIEHLPKHKMIGCCLNYARGVPRDERYYGYLPAQSSTEERPTADANSKADPVDLGDGRGEGPGR